MEMENDALSESHERELTLHNQNDNQVASPAVPFAAPARENEAAILYRSREMHELATRAKSFARSTATVLITGESGTGKELFARLVHDSSPRHAARFGRVNCAALSESLMESELFGHERGAFTGAIERRQGRFEWVGAGTLLLDEISEIPVGIQAKLLRVLEENEFQRVGSNECIAAHARVIATSNQVLHQQVQKNRFREDLYYRLNVLRIHLPPLRQRREDIPILANHFMRKFQAESTSSVRGFSKTALRLICEYDWPGNIRQLRNCIHAACVVAQGPQIQPQDLLYLEPVDKSPTIPEWMLNVRLDEIERHVIVQCLERFGGNKTLAAGKLGVSSRTLANKLKLYQQRGLPDLPARAG